MAEDKEEQAQETEKKKSVEDLRGFCRSVIAYFVVSLIPVIQRKKWLYYTCYPEKSQEAGYKHKHLPLSYLCSCQVTLCEDYTDNKEDKRLHYLEKLKPWNVVY